MMMSKNKPQKKTEILDDMSIFYNFNIKNIINLFNCLFLKIWT